MRLTWRDWPDAIYRYSALFAACGASPFPNFYKPRITRPVQRGLPPPPPWDPPPPPPWDAPPPTLALPREEKLLASPP